MEIFTHTKFCEPGLDFNHGQGFNLTHTQYLQKFSPKKWWAFTTLNRGNSQFFFLHNLSSTKFYYFLFQSSLKRLNLSISVFFNSQNSTLFNACSVDLSTQTRTLFSSRFRSIYFYIIFENHLFSSFLSGKLIKRPLEKLLLRREEVMLCIISLFFCIYGYLIVHVVIQIGSCLLSS